MSIHQTATHTFCAWSCWYSILCTDRPTSCTGVNYFQASNMRVFSLSLTILFLSEQETYSELSPPPTQVRDNWINLAKTFINNLMNKKIFQYWKVLTSGMWWVSLDFAVLSMQLKRGKGTLRMMVAGCDTGGNRPMCLEARGEGCVPAEGGGKERWVTDGHVSTLLL